jgi:hypothetical protein
MDQTRQIVDFCRNSPLPPILKNEQSLPPFYMFHRLRRRHVRMGFLENHGGPGWLCAQKRPMDALYSYLQSFQNNSIGRNGTLEPLPDFLLIVDDDTFVGVDHVLSYLLADQEQCHQQSSESCDRARPRVLAGCLLLSAAPKNNYEFRYPWGGFGTILNRALMQHLLQPLECTEGGKERSQALVSKSSPTQEFVRHACHRIAQNLMGEKAMYENRHVGQFSTLNLIQLMHQYVHASPFQQVHEWSANEALHDATQPMHGFCVHSDGLWGYFFNAYFNYDVAFDNAPAQDNNRSHRWFLQGYNHSAMVSSGPKEAIDSVPTVAALNNQCHNSANAKCTTRSSFCHYITPKRMIEIWESKQKH